MKRVTFPLILDADSRAHWFVSFVLRARVQRALRGIAVKEMGDYIW